VGIHSSGFRDFLLKPELLRAIQDCGFEHPSEGKFYFTFLLLANYALYYHLGVMHGLRDVKYGLVPEIKLFDFLNMC